MHSFCTIRWTFNKNGHYDGPVNDLSPTCPPLLLIIESAERLDVLPEHQDVMRNRAADIEVEFVYQ
jgi:hypothetical protein